MNYVTRYNIPFVDKEYNKFVNELQKELVDKNLIHWTMLGEDYITICCDFKYKDKVEIVIYEISKKIKQERWQNSSYWMGK